MGAGWSGNTVLPQLPKDSTHSHRDSHWKHLKIYVRSHVFVLAAVVPLTAFGQGQNSTTTGESVKI